MRFASRFNSAQQPELHQSRPRSEVLLPSQSEKVKSFTPARIELRPRVQGKFIFVGDEKLYVRGVTYGTFCPSADGDEYPNPEVVEQDFAQMASNGLNAVRTYTTPPRWLLDAAQRNDLRIMVGLSAERYIGYLNDKGAPNIERLIRDKVRACAGHPAVLCYAVGNEIPTSIVRWFGRSRVERYLKRLYRAVKVEDPESVVTYVNYPSTEYLQLPFLDLVCFNIYLESQEQLEAYLARLQNIAGERPLFMGEMGLDSTRHGEDVQAAAIYSQIRTVAAAGCAGAFVYAWTDEWYRGGAQVEDWAFGLTTRDRRPKPALSAARKAFAELPFPPDLRWPRISVVICSCNGARTIRDCFEGLLKLEYPDYEVIVVNDGSTDLTAAIAHQYGFRAISTENRGLSSARNTGMEAATGEIIAYTDDDARPDPGWLRYLAATFTSGNYIGVGGPNIAPPGDGSIAECVANAPGGPLHVLLSDREAEHIPGCNMAFRKEALQAIGGFDPQYRIAGDDVDVCWRLQQQGWKLGFNPAAVVLHHRRNSVRAYWKQQVGYGRAEALLERKWPEKYNGFGHLTWGGRVYGRGLTYVLGRTRRIYHGTWGSAPFQSLHQSAPRMISLLPLMPEWYLIIIALGIFSALGALWTPMLLALPLLALAVSALIAQAVVSAAKASFTSVPRSRVTLLKLYSLTTLLHLLQPLARLYGRLRHGLCPWRQRGASGLSLPWSQMSAIWTEHWRSSEERLRLIEKILRAAGACVLRGGEYDRWELEVRVGMLGYVRLLMAVEEHGVGQQLVRFYSWPKCSPTVGISTLLFAAIALGAAIDHAWVVSTILGVIAMLLALRVFQECATGTACLRRALEQLATEGA
jgi:GT2 family glycosyltransferase/exo-beta-1,3-glucanase (GH17 family)